MMRLKVLRRCLRFGGWLGVCLLTGSALGNVLRVPEDFGRITCALEAAVSGDVVVIAPGIYFENIGVPINKNVTITSADPEDPPTVMRTIFDGSLKASVFAFHSTHTATTSLTGVTVQNGLTRSGGGGITASGSEATISNCVLRNNVSVPFEHLGSGAAGIQGINGNIENNVIMDNENKTGFYCDDGFCGPVIGIGAGMSSCNGEVIRNIFVRNIAVDAPGSAMVACDGIIRNNLIRDHGGWAIYQCNGLFENNEIGLLADQALGSCSGTIARNYFHDISGVVINNNAGNAGVRMGSAVHNFVFNAQSWGFTGVINVIGNIFISHDGIAVRRSTIAQNNLIAMCVGTTSGFALIDEIAANNIVYRCNLGVAVSQDASIENNIFWDNLLPEPPLEDAQIRRYNILQDHNHGDPTNIVADPKFVDPENLDFRLQPDSPAIDAGVALASVTNDITGGPRPQGGGYDMGAVEFSSLGFQPKTSDSEQFGEVVGAGDLGLEAQATSDGLADKIRKGEMSDAFWTALRNGQPPPGVGIIDPPTWPEWVWNPEVPVPQDVVFPDVQHAADQDNDKRIVLGELLRIIQLFNSSGYLCSLGTEDDFAPGINGDTCCQRHSADYAPFDYALSLNELLRVIQFFNADEAMTFCGDSEDGFCLG